jgi:hypothetical protein
VITERKGKKRGPEIKNKRELETERKIKRKRNTIKRRLTERDRKKKEG